MFNKEVVLPVQQQPFLMCPFIILLQKMPPVNRKEKCTNAGDLVNTLSNQCTAHFLQLASDSILSLLSFAQRRILI